MWLETTLTIANGQTDSAELNLQTAFPAAKLQLTFFAPATLPETVTVKIAKTAGGTYVPLQSGGSDYTLPAGKATSIEIVAGALKLVAGAGVGADRVFSILAARSGE